MKKILLTLSLILGLASYGQELSENALGLRLGNNDGFGTEVSYQRLLSENNRIEGNLGWRNSNHTTSFKLVGTYQWIWAIDNGFNWYAGAGAGLGSWSYSHNGQDSSGSFGLVAGQVGIEYNFDEFPIQISLDFRPEIYLGSKWKDDFGPDIALGIRYRF